MLNFLRKASSNIFFRIFIFVIIISFLIWGIGDAVRNGTDNDLVKLKHTKNIKLSDFYKQKQATIDAINKNSERTLTQEELAGLNIDQHIIEELILDRLSDNWIEDSKIVISDKTVADYIKKIPAFSNNGDFDIDKFTNFLNRKGETYDTFYNHYKKSVAESILANNISSNVHTPKYLNNIITRFLAEEKVCDIIEINLSEKNALAEIKPTLEELEQFYLSHKDQFKKPETRNVNYITVNSNNLTMNDDVTLLEAENYYKDNKEEFSNIDFNNAKDKVIAKLKAKKQLLLFTEIAKQLEDQVASGESLTEIANKLKVKLNKNVCELNACSENNSLLSGYLENIFSMEENEVSYPLDLNSGNGFILLEVSAIHKSDFASFKDVKDNVLNKYIKAKFTEQNTKNLTTLHADLTYDNFNEIAAARGYKVKNDIKFTRKSLGDYRKDWPDQLLTVTFSLNAKTISNLIRDDNKAYFVKVKKTYVNDELAILLKKSNSENISSYLSLSFLDQIKNYYYTKNKPDIKLDLISGKNN